MSFRLDLHIHTESHGKTLITYDELGKSLKRNGLDGVAITNFFDISHAIWMKKMLPEHVIIIGQEIWAKEGHILGLGLKERIDDSLSALDTIGLIHEQGGIAVVPHPFIFLGIGEKANLLSVDAIEVYSGLFGILIILNYMSKKLAKRMNVSQVASTDTTDHRYIGHSHTEVLVDRPEKILKGIQDGKVRLHKRALPLPITFIVKCLLKIPDMEPCLLHAVPCFFCGKSMTPGLFKKKYSCLGCGVEQWSRISCCNGHYLCEKCVLKKGLAVAQEKEFICITDISKG